MAKVPGSVATGQEVTFVMFSLFGYHLCPLNYLLTFDTNITNFVYFIKALISLVFKENRQATIEFRDDIVKIIWITDTANKEKLT